MERGRCAQFVAGGIGIGVPPLSPLPAYPPIIGDALQRGRLEKVRGKRRCRSSSCHCTEHFGPRFNDRGRAGDAYQASGRENGP